MTIYDIARIAGVSASSVSRVVNNKPGVSPKMRTKIQAIFDEYHYVPNEAARGLVTNSSKLVGILIADVRTQHHTDGAYHIAKELAGRGYCGLILNTGDSDEERTKGIQILEQRKVEAAVLMGSAFQTRAIQDAISRCLPDIPVFILNGFLDLPNVYGVLSDEKSGVESCVSFLAKKGHQKIAYFVDRPTPSSNLKTQGFINGMNRLGLEEKDLWIYKDVDGSLAGGYEHMLRVLIEHKEVNGLICSLDIIACGALRALHDKGLRVPEDVAVIGVDNSIYAEICTPRLTSLDNMVLESGVTIAHKLVDSLEGHNTNQRTMLFTNIIERETT